MTSFELSETHDASGHRRAVFAHDDGRAFERVVAVLSIDTECIWGFLDKFDEALFEMHYPNAIAVTERLLTLLCHAGLSATWTVVGGFSLSGSSGALDPRMEGLPRSWVSPIRAGDESNAPLWYARSFVERVRDSHPAQDVGLHGGLTHMVWNDPVTPREIVCRELQAGIQALGEIGVVPRSFAFPRNVEGYHQLLASNGIRAYRGISPALSAKLGRNVPGSIMSDRRIGAVHSAARVARGTIPRTVEHSRLSVSLPNVQIESLDGSPLDATRASQARTGSGRPRRRGFPLLVPSRESRGVHRRLRGFETIVEEIVCAQRSGDIEVLTMKQIADRMEERNAA